MNTTLDLTNIPFLNLITLAIAVLAIIIVARKLGITKMGPIELEHEGQATNAMVLKQLEDIDSSLHDKVWAMTIRMTRQLVPPEDRLCYFGRKALMEAVLNPLQKKAALNHFTTRLTGGHCEQYKQSIMETIRDHYEDLRPTSSQPICDANPVLPEWGEVESYYNTMVDQWISQLKSLVWDACEQKVSIYNRAINTVKGDQYWSKVFKACKEKNEQYIRELE